METEFRQMFVLNMRNLVCNRKQPPKRSLTQGQVGSGFDLDGPYSKPLGPSPLRPMGHFYTDKFVTFLQGQKSIDSNVILFFRISKYNIV